MDKPCRRMDDVALRELFKYVDPSTLQKCRRVNSLWNKEIQKMSGLTRKFDLDSVMFEIHEAELFISRVDVKRNSESFVTQLTCLDCVKTPIFHTSSPETLMILIASNAEEDAFVKLIKGIGIQWSSGVKELEISSQASGLPFAEIIDHFNVFPNLIRLSISHYCKSRISMSEIFEKLPDLQFLRIYGLEPSSLVLDDAALDQLLKNQKEYRKIQRIEFFNVDISVSINKTIEVLKELAQLPISSSNLKFVSPTEVQEDSSSIHLLFENCRWDSIEELNLLSSIIQISSKVDFPILQPNDDILKGDFRFSIFDANFVLKFVTG